MWSHEDTVNRSLLKNSSILFFAHLIHISLLLLWLFQRLLLATWTEHGDQFLSAARTETKAHPAYLVFQTWSSIRVRFWKCQRNGSTSKVHRHETSVGRLEAWAVVFVKLKVVPLPTGAPRPQPAASSTHACTCRWRWKKLHQHVHATSHTAEWLNVGVIFFPTPLMYCNFTNFRCSFIFGIFGGQWFYRNEKDT